MLRAEGIQSYPVLIDSSRQIDVDIPSPSQFDHVITAARVGGSLIWLDTTPEVTPYGLLLYQLRNKEAVLASDDADGGLQTTPADSPIKTFMHFSLDGKFSDFGALDATLDLTAQGDRDWPLRSSFRRFSQAETKDFVKSLSASWGFPGEVEDVHIDSLEDTSKPFHLKYHLHQDRYFVVPSAGVDFRPLPALGLPAIRASENDTQPLNIGPAGDTTYKVRLQFPSNYTVRTPTPVKMSRDYGDYSSTYRFTAGASGGTTAGSLEGERKLVVKTNELVAGRRVDYDSFRNAAHGDEDQILSCTILTPSGRGAATTSAPASKFEGSPADLHKGGVKALQSKDYRSAIDLVKRAVDANPNLSDQAIASYRKQIEITPYDKETLKNYGLLLAQAGRNADARTQLEAAAAIPPDDPETKLALAQIYGRLGESAKAQDLLKGLTGSASGEAGEEIYAGALKNDVDPAQTENDAQQVLYDIGGQFDSGQLDRLGPSTFSSMRLVALAWARMGWAKFQRGENLAAMQFLNSSWLLSQSSTVANRLGQVFEKQGQAAKAIHMYALAIAAAGNAADVQDSRTRVAQVAGSPAAEKAIAQGSIDLVQERTVKLSAITTQAATARFNLVFDGSPRPERAEFVDGDESLRSGSDQLRQKDFPVRFPVVSSVKIVRQAQLTCRSSGCSIELLPLEK